MLPSLVIDVGGPVWLAWVLAGTCLTVSHQCVANSCLLRPAAKPSQQPSGIPLVALDAPVAKARRAATEPDLLPLELTEAT